MDKQEKEFLTAMIGKNLFFRTVTNYFIGTVTKIHGKFIYLENACWVANTGRFMNFLEDGLQSNSEIEPVVKMFLNMDMVVDFYEWKFENNPTAQQ
jgi:hypothetical protein